MNAIERAIEEAVEKGGYVDFAPGYQNANRFLDPLFWQALGKARGSNECTGVTETAHKNGNMLKDGLCWLAAWHRFIDHLAQGKHAESFFAEQ